MVTFDDFGGGLLIYSANDDVIYERTKREEMKPRAISPKQRKRAASLCVRCAYKCCVVSLYIVRTTTPCLAFSARFWACLMCINSKQQPNFLNVIKFNRHFLFQWIVIRFKMAAILRAISYGACQNKLQVKVGRTRVVVVWGGGGVVSQIQVDGFHFAYKVGYLILLLIFESTCT